MGNRNTKTPAVFLDRDGTLIHEKNYLRRVKDVRLFARAPEALVLLKNAGYRLVLVTNQSGIGRGYFTEVTLRRVHERLERLLARKGAALDAIYYCPHVPDDGCSCRKPKLGLIRKAKTRFGIDLKRSFAVGDHPGDFLLGQKMGGKGIFVLTGHGRKEIKKIRKSAGSLVPDRIEKDLYAAARWIVRQSAVQVQPHPQEK